MYILIFETIHEFISIAIFHENLLIDKLIYNKSLSHAESIIIVIETILSRNNLKYKDISYFATAIGPSSFIKIRIALSIALAIEFITNKKVTGINLFDLYKYISRKKFNIESETVILNAYQDNFYLSYLNYGKDQTYEFINIKEIDRHINNSIVICDSKSFLKLNTDGVKNLLDIQKYIENFSVSIGLYILESNIYLNSTPELKPFYLLNPSFVKKNIAR
jgi:tRNA threonylcarbamoyladenosine biosynthesis protein TsaB